MKFRIAAMLFVGILLAAAPVFAGESKTGPTCMTGCTSSSTTITFGGSTAMTYSSPTSFGSPSVTAYGYKCDASSATSTSLTKCVSNKLHYKNEGVGEIGLGLLGESGTEDEIGWDSSKADYVMGLDVSNLYNLGATSLTLSFSSVQKGENYTVWGYGSNPFGSSVSLKNQLVSFTGNSNSTADYSSTISLNSKDEFLVINAKSGNVLLGNVCYTAPSSPTPEPGTMALFGTGLLMLGYGLRRRLSATAPVAGK